MLRAFGAQPGGAGASGGRPSTASRSSWATSRSGCPRCPASRIAYVLWRGDEEFAPSASVVFDASVEGYLDAEAVTVLAELATRRLVDAASPAHRKE